MTDSDMEPVRKLDDAQVDDFDTEYVFGPRWDIVKARIDSAFPDGRFSFLDVGGGNGRFADTVLETYPLCTGKVLDSSPLLLSRNTAHPRKELVCATIESMGPSDGPYDIIFLHWVLHHLVTNSYGGSRRNQRLALGMLSHLLTPNGRLSLYENLYDGRYIDGFSARAIFEATSSRLLTRLTGKLGANTAGVGVCFFSRRQLDATIAAAGLRISDFAYPDPWPWPVRPLVRFALLLKSLRIGHYWLGR